jgi:hypothetical protein
MCRKYTDLICIGLQKMVIWLPNPFKGMGGGWRLESTFDLDYQDSFFFAIYIYKLQITTHCIAGEGGADGPNIYKDTKP